MATPAAFAIALLLLAGAIAWVDFRTLRIPDLLTLALALLGLAFQAVWSDLPLWVHVATSAMVLLGFWSLRTAHERWTGRVGLGLGDVKLAGACAIWLEPMMVPLFVFFASTTALAYVGATGWRGAPVDLGVRHPFGPFLCLGLLITLAATHLSALA